MKIRDSCMKIVSVSEKKKTSLQTFIRKKTEVDQDDKMQQVQGKCLRIKQKFVV